MQLPLALPEIMLGINQTILMALAMIIICAMIGTRDLGQEVFIALSKADSGRGIVAGLAIAFIGIIADRLFNAWSAKAGRGWGRSHDRNADRRSAARRMDRGLQRPRPRPPHGALHRGPSCSAVDELQKGRARSEYWRRSGVRVKSYPMPVRECADVSSPRPCRLRRRRQPDPTA